MKERFSHGWYKDVFYEHGAWPLWRLDLNLRYVIKSLGHCRLPDSPQTARWLARTHEYLEHFTSSPAADKGIQLRGLGDLMWLRSGYESFLSPGVQDILKQGHVLAANLETPLAARKSPKWVYETFHYNAPRDYIQGFAALKKPAVFSLCNNHALDQGESGLSETRAAVRAAGFACVGDDPRNPPALLHAAGIKLGSLGCTYGINHSAWEAKVPGVPKWIFGTDIHEPDWATIARAVRELKDAGADCVVMMPHWGYEYEYFPRDLQRAHAHRLIALGVDIILGSSPHVVQPVEIVSINGGDERCPVQVERADNKTPGLGVIAYSLGNFATIMPTLPCKCGMILKLSFEWNRGVIKKIHDLAAVPVTTRREGQKSVLDMRTRTLADLLGRKDASARYKKKLTAWLTSDFKRVLGPPANIP